jgi:TPR repeat protein
MSNDVPFDISAKDAAFSSGIAAFETKSFSQALGLLKPLADDGDAECQHRCAIMYQNGLGIVANEPIAF